MKYKIYKLNFQTAVHFGNGMLNDTDITFHADQLFSALYIEALKMGKADLFYGKVDQGEILFSDGFPYVGNQYFLPKPMIYVERAESGDSKEKKFFKNLKYIPLDHMQEYLEGTWKPEKNPLENLGSNSHQTMAAVRREDDTLPFHVGTFLFEENNGLYIITKLEDDEAEMLMDTLLVSVGYGGIGGKKSSGMGGFEVIRAKTNGQLEKLMRQSTERKLLLSTALPTETELENALEGASYLLLKRSGFVASDQYAEEERKKNDLYVFSAGSCFKHDFQGKIYDVSNGGKHSVYRYAKALFACI